MYQTRDHVERHLKQFQAERHIHARTLYVKRLLSSFADICTSA